MNRWIPGVVMLLAAWIAAGCGSTIKSQAQEPAPSPPARNTTLLAGVGKADITPRPGLPTAGYATNGKSGIGFRTRLYARVIYLKAADRSPVALVQCDLLSGSEEVHHRLAELVAKETDLDAGGIMMSGTHTHSGPGNLFGSDFYVKHASNKPGRDPKFFAFVCEQIRGAIIEAYKNRKPAKIATGSAEVYGFTRNRSISAYQANENADPGMAKDKRKAVNPEMHMVRVDCLDETSGAYKPAAALTSFSIHGTSVPSWNTLYEKSTLYNADVYAYMERELEWEMARKHGATRFVHAVVNGTHGDNAPDCAGSCVGYTDSRRLGLGLGRRAIDLFDSLAGGLRGAAEIRSAFREIDHYRNNAIDGIAICDPPRVGNTLTAGVEDGGPTPFLSDIAGFKEGSRRDEERSDVCQGSKKILLGGALQSFVLPRQEFPHIIAYQAIQLGNVVLLPLPFEFTMESGRRVVEACRKAAREGGMDADTRFVVVSVSNGYTGYCTTREEYGVQRYEGGHTLYGPNTNPFIAAQAAKLVGDMARKVEVRDLMKDRTFKLKERTFYHDYKAPSMGGRAAIAQPKRCKADGGEDCWSFSWYDVPPDRIEFHRRLVSIEYSDDGAPWLPLEENGIRVDDDGYDLSVAFVEKNTGIKALWSRMTGGKPGAYETRWYNPESKEGRSYRFRIEARQKQDVFFSNAFK